MIVSLINLIFSIILDRQMFGKIRLLEKGNENPPKLQ